MLLEGWTRGGRGLGLIMSRDWLVLSLVLKVGLDQQVTSWLIMYHVSCESANHVSLGLGNKRFRRGERSRVGPRGGEGDKYLGEIR